MKVSDCCRRLISNPSSADIKDGDRVQGVVLKRTAKKKEPFSFILACVDRPVNSDKCWALKVTYHAKKCECKKKKKKSLSGCVGGGAAPLLCPAS